MKQQHNIEGLKELNPNGFGGMVSRAIPIMKKEINFDEGIETIATTEAAAVVVDWERWQLVREILPMKYAEMPNNDKVPLLDSHSRVSTEKIKGSAKNFRTEGDKLIATTFISKTEEAIREKIKEGHLDSVSIGYVTDPDQTVEIPKKKEVVIDGTTYKNDYEDDMPLLVRTWWKTHELSLVPIGADDAAKFRSLQEKGNEKFFEKIAAQERAIEELKKDIEKIKSPVVEEGDLKRALKRHQLNKNKLVTL